MKIVIDINEKVYNRVRSLEPRKDGVMLLDTLMCAVQDGTVLPQNPTNGDIIKAIFPNVKFYQYEDVDILYGYLGKYKVEFSIDWWNAPYEGRE